jgi:hypothetical protein
LPPSAALTIILNLRLISYVKQKFTKSAHVLLKMRTSCLTLHCGRGLFVMNSLCCLKELRNVGTTFIFFRAPRVTIDISVKKFIVQTVRTPANLAVLEDRKPSNNFKAAKCWQNITTVVNEVL